MLEVALIISGVCFFTLLTAAIFTTIFRREIAISNRIDHYFSSIEKNKSKKLKEKEVWWRIAFHRYWTKGTELISKKIEKKAQLKLTVLLRDAGYSSLSAIEFRLIQLVISIGAGFFSSILMIPVAGTQAWLFGSIMAFLGFRYPIFYLGKKKTERIKEINREMADFFDMVNLLLEAGVGLDAALKNVCERKNGPLSEEFKLALEEMKRGKSRREALYNLKKRIPSDAFQSVLSSIIQADQLGVGMGKVIRNLTIRIREQRREVAREMAMKAPVKMLLPMILFIFPSLYIVILGPLFVKVLTGGLGG